MDYVFFAIGLVGFVCSFSVLHWAVQLIRKGSL